MAIADRVRSSLDVVRGSFNKLMPQSSAESRVQSEPGSMMRGPASRTPFISRWYGYYTNEAFSSADRQWADYRSKQKLYRHHRPLYNPTWETVEWYANALYGGVIPLPGMDVPKGGTCAMPFSDDTDVGLADALKMLMSWMNWQDQIQNWARVPAIVGGNLWEIVDDVPGGKVQAQLWWPHMITELVLDPAGNVKRYAIEYDSVEESMNPMEARYETFHYRKVVDDLHVEVWRDDTLQYMEEHPYTFAPAVWNTFQKIGSPYGEPALWASMGMIDELDDLASMAHDSLAKGMRAPVLLKTRTGIKQAIDSAKRTRDEYDNGESEFDRERIPILRVDKDSSIETIQQDAGQTLEYMVELLKRIERRHPEATMWESVREMSQLTGPGMDRAMGDVKKRYTSVMGRMDIRMTRFLQMGVTIASLRYHAGKGGWAKKTQEQEYFATYDEESFKNGTLNFQIEPRPMVEVTEEEEWDVRVQRASALAAEVALGKSAEQAMEEMGMTQEEIASAKQSKLEEQQQQADMALAQIQQQQQALGIAGTGAGGDGSFNAQKASPIDPAKPKFGGQ